MQIFQRVSKYTFVFSKHVWSEDDKFTSICIGFVEHNEYSFLGDARKIWPEALKEYMRYVFKELYDPSRKSYLEAINIQLRDIYSTISNRFKDVIVPKITYDKPLMKHQIASLKLMIQHKYNLLSFSQGLGKTITSATISKILDYKRTIIVCPAVVKWNWLHDLCDSWGYDAINFTILDSSKSKCLFAFLEKFVIVNYESIEKHRAYINSKQIDHIIIDESHFIKNPNTGRYLKLNELIKENPNARVTLLTGTPANNRINDLFAYYKITGHPLGKNKSYFDRQYLKKSNGFKGKIVGAKNLDELRVRHSNFMIRKTAEECLDLPPLIINKYYMDESEMNKEYMEVLQKMYQHRISRLQSGSTINELENQVSGNVHSLNRILATSKTKHVIDLIDKLWDEGRKVIVFSGYTAPLEILEEHFGSKCVKIDGSIDSFKRSKLIEKFISDKNCHVFLGNVKAAGVGINLINANDVIFLNFPFTPDDIEQPYKRAHRIGQNKTVNVYFTIVKNSIDEHIYNIIVNKSRDINNLLDKGKKGVVDYETNIMDKVFNSLLNKYAKDHGLQQIEEEKFKLV